MKNKLIFLLFLLLITKDLYPQHCGSLVLTAPSSANANQVWPLQLSWKELESEGDMVLDVQVPDHFTLLSKPTMALSDSGKAFLMILSSPFTPAKEYTIKVTLEDESEFTNCLTDSVCFQILPVPRAEALLTETQGDSLSFYLTSAVNVTLKYGSTMVLPGTHLKSTVGGGELVKHQL